MCYRIVALSVVPKGRCLCASLSERAASTCSKSKASWTIKEVVKANAVLTFDYDSYDLEKVMEELQHHVEKVTVPYRYPKKMKFVQQLPKTVSGKVGRNKLHQKWRKN